jgi:hypothetical protein
MGSPPAPPLNPATPARSLGWTRRILRGIAAVFAALWMVVEEWIWDSLTAFMAWLGRLPPVRWLEVRIQRLPPYAAMAVFVVPWALLLPAKILGLWLLGSGHAAAGVTVFVAAKLVGTAVLARLFTLTRPALLTIGWFRRVYLWFTSWRDRIYAYVRSLRAWQAARAWVARVRAAVRAWIQVHLRG